MDVRCRVKVSSFEFELEVVGIVPMYLALVGSLVSKIIEKIPFL